MKALASIYLFILGITLGVEVAIGLIAPVIFRSGLYIQHPLDVLDAGILLSKVFIKYNYIAILCGIFVFIFEIFSFKKNNIDFRIKFSTLMLSFIILLLAIIFTYFTNYISNAAAQNLIDEKFNSIHQASELVLKITMIAQALLFFIKSKIFIAKV